MADTLTFGILTMPSLPYPRLVERWRLIEDLGFDSIWLPDHFVNPRGPKDTWYETWTLMAALAGLTRRVRIGTLVTTMTLRNPALLAKQAMTVDHISGGRLVLGIGAGGTPLDYAMTGLTRWADAERFGRFREFAAILDRMLRQERTTYEGRYHRIVDAMISPPPIQRPRPPILIGGKSRTALRLTARLGDVWNTNGGRDLLPDEAYEVTRVRGALLDEYCAARGRDPRTVTRSFMLGQTREDPLASREALADFVGRYRALGFTEFILFWLRDPDPDYALYSWITDRRMLEQVATDWLPAIRRAT